MEAPTTNTEGLHRIANCDKQDRQADIVFVHGLGGTSHSTWRHGKEGQPGHFFWPEELGIDLSNCAIWSVGYPAGITNLGQPGMLTALRAGNIANKLANDRLGYRPLFFVTHSMGGLIVKSLVVRSQTLPDKARKRLVGMIRGIVFCATPHHGSDFADMAATMGKYLGGMTGAFLGGPIGAISGFLACNKLLASQRHVDEMRANAEQLDMLHEEFVEWHRLHPIAVLSYAENRNLRHERWFMRLLPLGKVVPHASANPGIAGQSFYDLDEDHLTLVKPSSRQCDVYAGVLRFISTELEMQYRAEPRELHSNPEVLPDKISSTSTSDRVIQINDQSNIHKVIPIAGQKGQCEPSTQVDEKMRLAANMIANVLAPRLSNQGSTSASITLPSESPPKHPPPFGCITVSYGPTNIQIDTADVHVQISAPLVPSSESLRARSNLPGTG